MKVVYVAGPFRADNAWEVECNIRRAEEASLRVWRTGLAAALCPHTNTRFFQGAAPDRVWIEGTLELLRRCDAMLVLPTAEKSTGTQGEIAEAERLGIKVFRYEECLIAWLKAEDQKKTISFKLIFQDIEKERASQDSKWGGFDHDDCHNADDWESFIVTHVKKCMDGDGAHYRKQMIRVAALAVAAVEWLERQEE